MIDCFDGMVVSWSLGTRPDAELVNTMLDAAIETVVDTEDRPVVHSDRGAHYRWPGWLSRIADAKLIRSMWRKGYSPDNAACEGFFGRLKTELFYPRNWQSTTIEQFIQAVDSYIRWYNEQRIKISLGSLDPAHKCLADCLPQCKTQWQQAPSVACMQDVAAGVDHVPALVASRRFQAFSLDARRDRRPVPIRRWSGYCIAGLLRADGRLCSCSACDWTDWIQAFGTLYARASHARCPERARFYEWLPRPPHCTPVRPVLPASHEASAC
ncbi:hypothetical protein GmRootV118_60530 [Variovorax sp. V118]